jgi:septum formation protein
MVETAPPGLVLASTSPYRRRLLEAAGVSFRVVAANVDEAALKHGLTAGARVKPAAVAEALAAAKASAVSSSFPEFLVVGADQVLALDDKLLDKPGDLRAARVQLERLRGRTHCVYSAVALAQGGQVVWGKVEGAVMTMRNFSSEFLDGYLAEASGDLCQIVGAYEIEGLGVQLFERVEGDHFTIIGLPLLPLLDELRARGIVRA